jgi:RNA polymerase sigma factor (sigma-70 family)
MNPSPRSVAAGYGALCPSPLLNPIRRSREFYPSAVRNPEDAPPRWFTEEVLPHEAALRAWLVSRFGPSCEVDDLVQETYARLLRAGTAPRPGAAKSFLFATARNLAVDQLRHRDVLAFEPIAESHESHVLEEKPGIAETVGHRQELELLTAAIQSLPDRCRQVLTLRKIYGVPQKEIAAQLGISEHTVEAQVGIGVRRCAEYLARYGLP